MDRLNPLNDFTFQKSLNERGTRKQADYQYNGQNRMSSSVMKNAMG
jgi:hypothetical protein